MKLDQLLKMLYNTRIKQLNRDQTMSINELQAYIEKDNARTQAWIDEAEGRLSTMLVSDPAHWAKQGVYTVADLLHNRAAADHYDYYKEVHGIRCRWMDYSKLTLEEIESEIWSLSEYASNDYYDYHEVEDHCNDLQDEKEQYADRMDCDPTPNKYEVMTLRAGYEA